MEQLPIAASTVRLTFATQRTKAIEYRILQLRKLYWSIVDNTPALIEACKIDLNKSATETVMAEIDWVKNDIVFVQNSLAKWMKDEPAPDVPLSSKLVKPKVRKEPLGAVLILGCWNFPVQLSLGPMVGAIAAGCTVVLKPSEVSAYTAMVVSKIVNDALDKDAYIALNGAVSETTALLNEKWDKIFYTGNTQVGTIIAKKAAETLTPVCLELGGRNPAVVTKHADLRIAARRLTWGKILNAGQVCLSQNYVLVDKAVLGPLVEQFKVALKEFYPQGAQASPDFGHIVNSRHFHRIKKMLDESKGEIVYGGETDEATNFIAPTVVVVPSEKDSLITEESFGPIISILPVENLDDAIRIINAVHSTPLGFYPFGNKAEISHLLSHVTSGGASVNDAFFHGSITTLPFGGVGDSGQGAYHGRASFDCFTHRRSITHTPGWIEFLLAVRYPPYSVSKVSSITDNALRLVLTPPLLLSSSWCSY